MKAGAAAKNVLRGKAVQKKKKEHLRFGVDCTNIAEDNIMDVSDFVSFFTALVKVKSIIFIHSYRKNISVNTLKYMARLAIWVAMSVSRNKSSRST